MGRKKMCEQTAVLELMKNLPNNGGLSKAAKALHEAQCRDFEKMEERMNSIENKVNVIEKKVDSIDSRFANFESKFDDLTKIIKKRSNFKQNLMEILNNRVFLYILITIMCSLFGVKAGDVATFLFK